ncbi:MAG: geranylgeranyl reductase family protein [Candidatus Diapherotrites archaeon]|nr:geranylgeranyl reductase family protein [Candidatus Diapherotrites archaeon]
MTDFDVIVVGGGPGGSTTGVFLAKAGKKVLLLEKEQYPKDKTCGDAVSGKSVKILRELGLQKEMDQLEQIHIDGVTISSPNGTLLDVNIPKTGVQNNGYVCKRMVYDNFLFQNMKKQKNITVKEKFMVTGLLKEGDQVVGVKGKDLISGKEEQYTAKIVVGADSAHSIVAKELGLNEIDEKHYIVALRLYYEGVTDLTNKIEIHFVPELIPGYFWIFPTIEGNQKGECNVGVGMIVKDLKKKKVNLEKAMFKAIEENPLFKERFKNAKKVSPVKGWNLPLGSKVRKCAGNGFVLVGDAASLIDPFTGEGIGNAMTSGKLASEVIVKAFEKNDFSHSVLKEYQDQVEKILRPELMNSYKLQKVASNTFLLNWVTGKAKRNPKLADFIGGTLVNENTQEKIGGLKFFIKIFFS